ncbi:long-chain-fatty-acid--CoA ligase [Cupriavidus consociatus]|uniref:long-chain-fatty-acid--CoA ligase n=1 Tax=Cupriavidus consociatus TaxID=2821357 RepID=UPI001AE519D0|nr:MULTISPECIES: long-chain-fatty-acid--CoA ligase [unclassified Cupriavidus]MBP0623012.1 long-chain-fatty-acid--CoA ligase [Cupriavidus sp. LEh25]MDK2659700.1 long-chain-fatty-acid--CoA ligase [Cupriavidus sp. LEh21]
MLGLMQDRPLLISSLIEYAAAYHPRQEIVSRTVEGDTVRSNYETVHRRARRAANALAALGVRAGDRVGTLAWNTHRHLELYFGVSGSEAVLHTINPRLFPEQVAYIINHAEDRVLCFDTTFAPLVAQLAPQLAGVQHYVALTSRAQMPAVAAAGLPQALCYEDLLDAAGEHYAWPQFDERTASSLCYTSGTTGNPKGVLYSHRSTVLHSLKACAADTFGVGPDSSILLIVPLFHANAWGLPYACAMNGAKMVLPAQHLDGESVYRLLRDERVNYSTAVPTVWLMLFQYLDAHPEIDPSQLALKVAGVGGSAVPAAMIERFDRQFGARLMQGWGMTETSPIGVINTLLPQHAELDDAARLKVQLKQGRALWGVDLRIEDDAGNVLPHDGVAFGRLKVRGPWIASGYFKAERDALDAGGWFDTGDVATIDADGYVQLVDRAKDVIKSGGEWISSIDVENATMGHPAVAEAAVIGVPHPKWQERPLLVAVKRPGHEVSAAELLDYLGGKMVRWWVPDDVVFVDALPHTATGKLLKVKLRDTYRDYVLPTVDTARSA